ncbi:Fur family transcriptional regulator [Staphylococcus massiliensis]|uniref:Ferric uptake regulation protein n=1 Tax=Staphylococcus massiliensis S46 TaxID=1229783 RepID=K9AV05_9STAP|nr:Fur family transcriptional regulator [Staphylococcus massiliensis]EKU49891.1 FUR family transcriptional regulator [Staphylococcus massiliensis S46]MCG3398995.1 transcriptional repressor [Staphylococcus massiliensis]MCG3401006.1 transcriptional repressor [Staphylococcus massiliensis]MCG3413044.1 transcriptional repressor [Staphylococcus massiliensis]PNZ98891.1 transcriptional repressor [Staphylococcus massiliensis CCUG 55927]
MNVNDAIQILKSNGHKYTDKRRDMAQLFIDEDKYINAKHVQKHMNTLYPGISFDTVYRNLHLFKDLDIIESTELDGEMKFRIACTDHHHHHFICESCGDTKVIDYCPIDEIKSQLPKVDIQKHKLEVYGICEKCNAK